MHQLLRAIGHELLPAQFPGTLANWPSKVLEAAFSRGFQKLTILLQPFSGFLGTVKYHGMKPQGAPECEVSEV